MQKIIKPWGGYTDLFRCEKCVFKMIFISPGCGISYQKHFERDEHWYIVSGSGWIKIAPPGDTERQLKNYSIEETGEGEQITVPREYAHQLWNDGEEDLVLYEMQTGVCREDDIERLDDPYKDLR